MNASSDSEGDGIGEGTAGGKRPSSIPVAVQVSDTDFLGLADSGASETVITPEVAKMLHLTDLETMNIRGFGGTSTGHRTRKPVPVTIQGRTTSVNLLIAPIPGSHYQVVLGVDVMHQMGILIDTKNRGLIFRDDARALRAMADAADQAAAEQDRPRDAFVRLLRTIDDKPPAPLKPPPSDGSGTHAKKPDTSSDYASTGSAPSDASPSRKNGSAPAPPGATANNGEQDHSASTRGATSGTSGGRMGGRT